MKKVNLNWKPLLKDPSNPQGPNFTPLEICQLMKEIDGQHACPPKLFWPIIRQKGQKIDSTSIAWAGRLTKHDPWSLSIGEEDCDLRSHIVSQIKTEMTIAGFNKIPKCILSLGAQSGSDRTAQWERTKDSLGILVEHAKVAKVQLCIEVLNIFNFTGMYGARHKGYPGQFTDKVMDLLCLTDLFTEAEGHLGIIFDVYHAAVQLWCSDNWDRAVGSMTQNLLEMYDALHPHIADVHVSGFSPNMNAPITRCAPHYQGQIIDYDTIFSHIWESGYSGRWTIESYLESPLFDEPSMSQVYIRKSQACDEAHQTTEAYEPQIVCT